MFLVELLMVKLEINTATHISCGDSSFYPAVNTAATQPSVVGLTTAARALSHSVEVSSDQGMFPHHQELVELDSFSWLDTDFRLSDKSIDQTMFSRSQVDTTLWCGLFYPVCGVIPRHTYLACCVCNGVYQGYRSTGCLDDVSAHMLVVLDVTSR